MLAEYGSDEEDRIKLVETCGACPEQYDAYYRGEKVGYLRLRHGYFYCENLRSGLNVYDAHPQGDGIFDYNERDYYLNAACTALLNALKSEPPRVYEIVSEDDI